MTLRLNGATNGSVSLDAPATGSDVSFTLPGSVGTSGQLLSTNGAGVLSFVNGGKILQVVRATDSTNRSTTSTSYVDVTGMSVTITPQRSDSLLYIFAMAYVAISASSSSVTAFSRYALTDSSNNTLSGAQEQGIGMYNLASATPGMDTNLALVGYVAPATTSAVTYKLRFRSDNANYTTSVQNQTRTGQMIAFEVAA